jgi:hypothetical protein
MNASTLHCFQDFMAVEKEVQGKFQHLDGLFDSARS